MIQGRPQQYEFAKVFESALQLFWSKGYESTSLEDLLKATGLSRSSFYQAFVSKRDLYLKCLDAYDDHSVAVMKSDLDRAESGREFLEGGFVALCGDSDLTCNARGCMMMNAANEFAKRDEEIGVLVKRNTERICGVLTEAVERARSEGDLKSTESPEVLADYLFIAHSGMIAMMKTDIDRERIKRVSDIVLARLF
jgi:TetR/AcrR family transcriptional regulator, transcriptional repressor for nem operon